MSTKINEISHFTAFLSGVDESTVKKVMKAYAKLVQIKLAVNDEVHIPGLGTLTVKFDDEDFYNKLKFNIELSKAYRYKLINMIKTKGRTLLEKETKKTSKILRNKYKRGE